MANARILIVEDDGIIATRLQSILEKLGYDVIGAVASGEEAVQKARESSPGLVLMDIYLAGDMNGIEAAAEIHTQSDVPVVYLTAYSTDELLQQARITGPYGYLIKPIGDRELHATIEMALYRYELETRLKENERWLATILRSIGDAVIATDEQGTITFMNHVAEELTGWKQEETSGHDLAEVFHIVNEDTKKPVENPVAKVIREGIIIGLANHTMLFKKNGKAISIDDSAAPIRDDRGNITGVVLVFRDVTERRQMEEELMKVQKLESVGVLAGGIAHDLNNLLTGILGNISLARMYDDPADKNRRLLDAEKASMQVKDLAQRLLTFSSGGAPILQTVAIENLLRDSISLALSGSNVRCELSVPDDLWPVQIDEGQINQVFNNLVINANQAMPNGGVIRIDAENLEVDAKHGLPLSPGAYIRISIADQGVGIAREYLQRVFDPFFTTKQKGSGLGLATSFSIVKQHKGLISAESTLGVGATFHVYLPAAPEQILATEEAESEIIMGEGRILVMDDEEHIRDLVIVMLSRCGYEVVTAKDGAKAIELYKNAKGTDDSFDLVITDLTVPGGMGGQETIQRLMELDPDVKAIISSGYSNDPVMANFREYGFQGIVAKPYKLQELSKVLNKIIEGEPGPV